MLPSSPAATGFRDVISLSLMRRWSNPFFWSSLRSAFSSLYEDRTVLKSLSYP